MKITVYTTTDCQFSKQEKEYLTSNKLQYEEKNLETNKDFLTEMLAVSNNFAGTPVTRVEKDDGAIVVLKGFTKEEFDTAFGLVSAPAKTPEPVKTEEPPVKPVETTSPVKTEEKPPVVTPVESQPTTPPPVETTPPIDEKLDSVLNKLEEKTDVITPQPAETTPTSVDTTIPPTPPPADSPVVPDFPADSKTTV